MNNWNIDMLWMLNFEVNLHSLTPLWCGWNSKLIEPMQCRQKVWNLPQINQSPTNDSVVSETLHKSLQYCCNLWFGHCENRNANSKIRIPSIRQYIYSTWLISYRNGNGILTVFEVMHFRTCLDVQEDKEEKLEIKSNQITVDKMLL